jgi:hypothetical protein
LTTEQDPSNSQDRKTKTIDTESPIASSKQTLTVH